MRNRIESILVEKLRALSYMAAKEDFGVPEPSDEAPLADGTAAPGTGTAYSRGDHVHPRDTMKADVEREIITVNIGSFSSLPKTVSNDAIRADHTVMAYALGTPYAQVEEWTVETSAGSLTITGNMSGSTTMKIILGLAGSSI